MSTYCFKAVIEPDEEHWYAKCPIWLNTGATWGETPEETSTNLEEVVRMVVASLLEHGDPIPAAAADGNPEARSPIAVAV